MAETSKINKLVVIMKPTAAPERSLANEIREGDLVN